MAELTPEEQEQLSQANEAIWENIRRGFMEYVGNGPDGAPLYQLTEAGKRYVEDMIAREQSRDG